MGNVKYELNNLEFEKTVALEALGKINQFYNDKKIDEYERDRLSRKYNKILDDYNKRVFQIHPILEAQEIYEYKKDLHSIVAEYTKKIDTRLESLIGSTNLGEQSKSADNIKSPSSSSPRKSTADINKSGSLFSRITSLKAK